MLHFYRFSGYTWSRQETLLLIDLYSQFKHYITEKKMPMNKFWILINTEMMKKGYNPTSKKCSSKWASLERAYKKIKDNNKKTGRGAKKFPFFGVIYQNFNNFSSNVHYSNLKK